MKSTVFSRAFWLSVLAMALLFTLPTVQADSDSLTFLEGFGTEVCAADGRQNPWPHASGKIRINQRRGTTTVRIKVRKVAPDTLYTIWLLLEELNPLTENRPFTALANPSDIPKLATYTPDVALSATAKSLGLTGDNGSGIPDAINGFRTDSKGKGGVKLELDFPLIKGAYQYQEFAVSLKAIATGNTQALDGLRLIVVSHCADDRAHGLVDQDTAIDETWFVW